MPALDEKDYAEFNRILGELAPEVDDMKETPQSFVRDMVEKNKLYGERMFVSPKQFVGDTDHDVEKHGVGPGNRDMDDDISF